MALDVIHMPCMKQASLERRQAMQSYVDFLKIKTLEELSDNVSMGTAWKKTIDAAERPCPEAIYKWAKTLETKAVAQGCPYDLRLGGVWSVDTKTLLDVLDLCGLTPAIPLFSTDIRRKLKKPKFTCYSHVLKAFCDLTGSLPEELAERV